MKRFLILLMASILFVSFAFAENLSNTDMDIILRDGHPTILGSVKQSHEIWNDVKKRINFGDTSNLSKVKDPILYMDRDFKSKDLIKAVEIYFYNFDPNPNLSLEEALPIAADYLPFDILSQYFVFERSFMKTNKSGEEFYTVSYSFTKEAAEKYRAKEIPFSLDIDVIFKVVDGAVQYITIGSRNVKWYSSKEASEWECDLFDYADKT